MGAADGAITLIQAAIAECDRPLMGSVGEAMAQTTRYLHEAGDVVLAAHQDRIMAVLADAQRVADGLFILKDELRQTMQRFAGGVN